MSIGKFAKNLILTTQLSNTQILEEVLKAFPTAKTSMACIAWYKSDLRKKNILNDKKVVEKTLEDQLNETLLAIDELVTKKEELMLAIMMQAEAKEAEEAAGREAAAEAWAAEQEEQAA